MFEVIPNWHPAVVHFPVAFTAAALAFTAIGTLFRDRTHATQCRMMGRWMLWVAALGALAAATFGWFAFNRVEHDGISHSAVISYRNWALGALTMLLALPILDMRHGLSSKVSSYGFLGMLLLAWLLVASTAWHGAELVYRHGLGVMPLPDSTAIQGAHDYDDHHP